VLLEPVHVPVGALELNGLELTDSDAAENIDAFKAKMRFLDETAAVFTELSELMKKVECSGKQFHDANVVATALTHGVARILTAHTTDFERFTPFIEMLSLAEV
jgi:predicted nucleic acid-binding protein